MEAPGHDRKRTVIALHAGSSRNTHHRSAHSYCSSTQFPIHKHPYTIGKRTVEVQGNMSTTDTPWTRSSTAGSPPPAAFHPGPERRRDHTPCSPSPSVTMFPACRTLRQSTERPVVTFTGS